MSKEFICKGCGEKFNKDMQSNNVGYCYICNEFYMRKQLADLEAKLADIEESARAVIDANFRIAEERDKLKQQLAEKETRIYELKQRLKDTIKIYSDDFVEKDKELKELRFQARNIFPLVENLEDKVNQDKISFCIEKLEKVKEKLNDYDIQEILSSGSDPYGEFDENCVTTDNINTIIDNQIEELKKGL